MYQTRLKCLYRAHISSLSAGSEITENQMNKLKLQSATREIEIAVQGMKDDDDDVIRV